MPKNFSLKFWIAFWTISAVFLSSWFLFWNTKNKGLPSTVASVMHFLLISQQQKDHFQALSTFGNYFLKKDDSVKTFLVLFQNNLEISPGGGFIGAFGVVKIK